MTKEPVFRAERDFRDVNHALLAFGYVAGSAGGFAPKAIRRLAERWLDANVVVTEKHVVRMGQAEWDPPLLREVAGWANVEALVEHDGYEAPSPAGIAVDAVGGITRLIYGGGATRVELHYAAPTSHNAMRTDVKLVVRIPFEDAMERLTADADGHVPEAAAAVMREVDRDLGVADDATLALTCDAILTRMVELDMAGRVAALGAGDGEWGVLLAAMRVAARERMQAWEAYARRGDAPAWPGPWVGWVAGVRIERML